MNNKFSGVIYELRRKFNYTQQELGKRLGVTNKTISKWEIGEISPDISSLLLLSELFNISVDELLTGFAGKYDLKKELQENKMEVKRKRINVLINAVFLFTIAILIVSSVFLIKYVFIMGLLNAALVSFLLFTYFFRLYRAHVKKNKLKKKQTI